MKMRMPVTFVAIATAAVALALFGSAAANAASPGDFSLSSTSVPAGGTVVLTGVGWGSDAADSSTIITLEQASSSGAVGGSNTIVTKTIPASADAWTYELTIPAGTTPGEYSVCDALLGYQSSGGGKCVPITVVAATPGAVVPPGGIAGASTIVLSQYTAVAGGKLSLSAVGFSAGEQVQIFVHSAPVLLNTVTADPQGAVSATVTLPARLSLGAHTMELKGLSSGVNLSASFTIGGVPSAATDVVAAAASGVTPLLTGLGGFAVLLLVATGAAGWRRRLHAATQ